MRSLKPAACRLLKHVRCPTVFVEHSNACFHLILFACCNLLSSVLLNISTSSCFFVFIHLFLLVWSKHDFSLSSLSAKVLSCSFFRYEVVVWLMSSWTFAWIQCKLYRLVLTGHHATYASTPCLTKLQLLLQFGTKHESRLLLLFPSVLFGCKRY